MSDVASEASSREEDHNDVDEDQELNPDKDENTQEPSVRRDKKPTKTNLPFSAIDLQNKELIKALESLPTTRQFLDALQQQEDNKDAQQQATTIFIPNLREIHRVVHELLPKPNRGLWEPQFNLDPFLLNYMALLYQNNDKQKKAKQENLASSTIEENKASSFRISKLWKQAFGFWT